MHQPTRRDFLRSIAVSGTVFAIPSLLLRCSTQSGAAPDPASIPIDGIRPSPAIGSGAKLLDLPDGFEYTVFGEEGTPLSDGTPTPGLHGGLGVFKLKGGVRVLRSHGSLNPGQQSDRNALHMYDPVAGGAVTTVDFDANGAVIQQLVSLSGLANAAGGGPTTWRSWVVCEATTRGVDAGYTQPHGYCFEIRADVSGGMIPLALKGLGRFVHASFCMDPETQIVYLTEHSQPGAGFYRYLPRRARSLAAGGHLQMLTIAQQPGFDARGRVPIDQALPVTWTDIAEPDPAQAEANPHAVYEQGVAGGAVSFGRIGGVTCSDGALYFATLDGSDSASRKLWEYRVRASRQRAPLPTERVGTLQLRNERAEPSALRIAGELCAAPDGTILLVERSNDGAAIRAFTRSGRIYDFARLSGQPDARFGGSAFSPDGRTLFLNQYAPGRTFAIRGPFARLGL